MLSNYLKVFLRLFARNRVFTLINLLGLSTGIACFVLIRMYVAYETVYDRHLPDAENTYRLAMKGDMSGFSFESAVMGGPFGRAIREDVPEVSISTTFYKLPRPVLLSREENRYYEESIVYADSAFLEFFGFEVLLGDPATMFDAPFSMVLTRSGAKKYFGGENPVGKTIRWNNARDYTVTGVIEDPVYNSHLRFNILASFNTLLELDRYRNLVTTFYAFVTYNYIKLDGTAILSAVQDKIDAVVEKNMGEGMEESGSRFELFLQPVTNIHLDSDLVHELEPNGNRASVRIFSAISILILLIACVNFINLTTARSGSRLHEIGIRQTNGAGRNRLFRQFIIESVLFSLLSVLLAWLLIELSRNWFYNFSGIRPEALPFSNVSYLAGLLVLGIVIGVVSGAYPAVHISRQQWLLRGTAGKKPPKRIFRNVLVVSQLAITIFLVFNTLLIYKQLQLVSSTDIGINKDRLLILPMRSPEMNRHFDMLRDEMMALPNIREATASSGFLGDFQQRRGFFVEGFERNDMWMLHHISVEPEYLEVMEVELIKGRNFRTGSRADSNAVIINAAMMKQADWEEPIGKKITMPSGGGEIEFRVIGVVEDFNYASVHSKVESLLLFNSVLGTRYLGLRLSGDDPGLEVIGKKWTELYPEYPFDYFFQEDFYDDLYREDRQMGSLFIYFTIMAILISVLGLFGLVLFTSSRRNKEIGIRKVMGGDTPGLLLLLLKEYPLLILISSAFALPAAWYFGRQWLENFALKTEITVWIFVFSILLVLLICLSTIVARTLKTARANPVEVLRYE